MTVRERLVRADCETAPLRLALRPAIAVTKWMSGVQFAERIRGAVGKHRSIQVNEVVLGREFVKGLLHRWFEEGSDSEEMAALGHVHRPKLSRPFVHILENAPVNRLEVPDIESPRNESID